MATEFQFRKMKWVWEMDSGDGCTALRTLNTTKLLQMVMILKCVTFILPQLKTSAMELKNTYYFMETGRETLQDIIKMTIYHERGTCFYLCFSVRLHLCPEMSHVRDEF